MEEAFLRGLLILPSHLFIGKFVPPGLAFEKAVLLGPKEVKAGDDESSKFISTLPLIFELTG